MLTYTTLFVAAFLGALLLTPLVRHFARRAGVFDVPDGSRKIHATPIPRLGGLAVALGFYASLFAMLYLGGDAVPPGAAGFATGMLIPALLVLGVGVADDLWSVKPWVKLSVQVAAGLWVYFVLDLRIDLLASPLGGESTLGVLSLPATLLWIALVTNAFNIVDGMDGLAAGVSLIAATCVFVVSLQQYNWEIAFLAAPLAGAVLGFLRYNFNPASIFLGDTGSLFLGFQLAVLSMTGSQKSSTAIAIVVPMLIVAFPLIETTTSMVRRFLRGEPIMQADRGHIHHQLLRLGLTTRSAVLLLYVGSAVFGLTSLFLVQKDAAVIGLTAVTLAVLTCVALQWLGYPELVEIKNAFARTFVYQRQVISRSLYIRQLADDLRGPVPIDVASQRVGAVAERLGFSQVMLRCGRPDAPIATLGHPTMPDLSRHTVMSLTLAGRTGEVGELVLARPKEAGPLHSELPAFIEMLTAELPAVVERAVVDGACADRHAPAVSASAFPASGRLPAQPLAFPAGPRAPRPSSPLSSPPEVLAVADTALLQPCVSCGETSMARSRSRTLAERLRKALTRKRPYRCSACGWRGWLFVLVHIEAEAQPPMVVPDLSTLDRALTRAQPLHAAL